MAFQRLAAWKRTGTTIITEELIFIILQSLVKQLAELPDGQRMCEANEKTDYCGLNVLARRALDEHKPIIVVDKVQKKADDGVEFSGFAISVNQEDQNKELNYCCNGHSIDPVEKRITGEGHVKVFELHEKVTCVGYIQHHKDKRPVKDGLLAFQIGDYLIHSLCEKVFETGFGKRLR